MTGVAAPPTARRGRRTRYDVIVVGSGMGGAVAAGLLAHVGQRVLVVEKNRALGGVLASHRRAGFKIDTGSHLIARGRRGPIGRALRAIGAQQPRFITHPIPVRSRGIFEITAPAHRRGLPAVALEAARALSMSRVEMAQLARMLFHVFTLTELELRRWDRRTLDQFIRRHTAHAGAYFLFSFLASIFFVLPPWQVSAGEAIRSLRAVLGAYQLSYVEGGMDSLIHALLAPVVRGDGDVVVGAKVVEVRRRAGGLCVTTTTGDEYRAPFVICNLAPRDALALIAEPLPDDYRARVAALRPSGNAHQIRLGLSRKLVDEGCIIGGASPSGLTLADLSLQLARDTVAAIDAGRVTDPIAVYAPVPSNYDPSLAPEGCQLIVCSVYGPTRPDPVDSVAVWRAHCMTALRALIDGLDDALLFAEFSPIPAIASWMGKSNRGAISSGQFPDQVGPARLPVSTPIPGLYLCGDGAGGRGIGTELATCSAFEAVDAVVARLAQREAA